MKNRLIPVFLLLCFLALAAGQSTANANDLPAGITIQEPELPPALPPNPASASDLTPYPAPTPSPTAAPAPVSPPVLTAPPEEQLTPFWQEQAPSFEAPVSEVFPETPFPDEEAPFEEGPAPEETPLPDSPLSPRPTAPVSEAPAALTGPVSGLRVLTQPARTVYAEGEAFDPTGLSLAAVLSDGTEQTLSVWDWTPRGPLTAEDDRVVVSYGEGAALLAVELPIRVWRAQGEAAATGAVSGTAERAVPGSALLALCGTAGALTVLSVILLLAGRRKRTLRAEELRRKRR